MQPTKQFLIKVLFRRYFINLIEKTTTWEDPRNRYKQAYNAAIPLQDLSRVSREKNP